MLATEKILEVLETKKIEKIIIVLDDLGKLKVLNDKDDKAICEEIEKLLEKDLERKYGYQGEGSYGIDC